MPTAPVIELRDVSRDFGSQPVLHRLNLHVSQGETLAIIGQSGCGKSVTLKLMMGLLEPTSGEVCWDGRPLGGRSARQLRRERLRFGFLFQGAALFDSLNVFENVAFGLRENTRLNETEIRRIVHDRLNEVGLSPDICGKSPAELSGGMRKRVGFARAFALSPDVMLYDEPTTGLDPIMSDVIDTLILQARQRHGVTGVVVTHDLRTVRKVADRVVLLRPLGELTAGEEQIAFEGTPQQLFSSREDIVRQFVEGDSRMVSAA